MRLMTANSSSAPPRRMMLAPSKLRPIMYISVREGLLLGNVATRALSSYGTGSTLNSTHRCLLLMLVHYSWGIDGAAWRGGIGQRGGARGGDADMVEGTWDTWWGM